MADGGSSHQFIEIAMEGAKAGVVAIIGWMSWVFRKHGQRLTDLERETIQRAEYNETIKSLRDDIKNSARETHDRLDKLYLHISKRGKED